MPNHFKMGGKKITGLARPTSGNHAATKQYVDDQVAAILKHYITVWTEESGNLTMNNLEWSFGNRTSNNYQYG